MTERGEHPWRDGDILHELYVERGLSTREVGEELGCASRTVSTWLERNGIEADRAEAAVQAQLEGPVSISWKEGYLRWDHQHRKERDKVLVHRLVAVAEFGVGAVKDMVVHHKNGVKSDNRPENIELLDDSEHSRHHKQRVTESDREKMAQMYREGRSSYEIAPEFGVGSATVIRNLKQADGVRVRTERAKGRGSS